jgi:uncharacterized protein YndB with AHSA1/START domain
MTTDAPIRIRVERRFASPAERVFDAWLNAASAGRWLFATPGGEMIRVEIDPRVGGRWTVVERRPGGDASHSGTYTAIDRPHRLAFTFTTDPAEPPSLVTVTIAPDAHGARGGCALALVHEIDAKWADWAERTRQGWHGIVDGLARTLGE